MINHMEEDFVFKNDQIIWVRNPKIICYSDTMPYAWHGDDFDKKYMSREYSFYPFLKDDKLIKRKYYLFQSLGSEFELGFHHDTRSCKINGIEMNQNGEEFDSDKYWEIVKTLPNTHPMKHRGISGPPGYYVYSQSTTSEFISNNPSTILLGEFLDHHNDGVRFCVGYYYKPEDVLRFNNLFKSENRNNKISTILAHH